MEDLRCGSLATRSGEPCGRLKSECSHHQPRDRRPRSAPRRATAPDPVARRDLRGTGWWLMERLTAVDAVDEKRAAVAATVLRVLASLGPEPANAAEALAEVELRGRLMHGQPPSSPEQWERAARAFDPDALEEFRRWDLANVLLEGDRDDEADPLV